MQSFNYEELRAIRQQSGLTQVELAEKLGITSRTVKSIEAGNEATIASLKIGLIKKWWKACHESATEETRQSFIGNILSFIFS